MASSCRFAARLGIASSTRRPVRLSTMRRPGWTGGLVSAEAANAGLCDGTAPDAEEAAVDRDTTDAVHEPNALHPQATVPVGRNADGRGRDRGEPR